MGVRSTPESTSVSHDFWSVMEKIVTSQNKWYHTCM